MAHPNRILNIAVFVLLACTGSGQSDGPANLNEIPNDLCVPAVTTGAPRAGIRVWQKLTGYEDWDVAHAIYLPTDWQPDKRYPVLFEYPGNGGFQNELGDRSDGKVADCQLGYGLTGGEGMIWVSMPFIDPKSRGHARLWWGDPDATARYCKLAAAHVCKEFGGDAERLVLVGFSRGAIACNYIGLRDDEIAGLWRAFLAHSHYDGVKPWVYADSDEASAVERLQRLRDRPQFISHEQSTVDVEVYLRRHHPKGTFTFAALPYANHSSAWALKDVPFRVQAREWLAEALQ